MPAPNSADEIDIKHEPLPPEYLTAANDNISLTSYASAKDETQYAEIESAGPGALAIAPAPIKEEALDLDTIDDPVDPLADVSWKTEPVITEPDPDPLSVIPQTEVDPLADTKTECDPFEFVETKPTVYIVLDVFHCVHCSQQFASNEWLQHHLLICPYKTNVSENINHLASGQTYLTSSCPTNCACPKCSHSAIPTRDLRSIEPHKIPYQTLHSCPCGQNFATDLLLQFHIREKHNGSTPTLNNAGFNPANSGSKSFRSQIEPDCHKFPCRFCGRDFSQLAARNTHIKTVHEKMNLDFKSLLHLHGTGKEKPVAKGDNVVKVTPKTKKPANSSVRKNTEITPISKPSQSVSLISVNSATSTSINSLYKMINNIVNDVSDPKSVTSVKESTLMANRPMPGDKLASQSVSLISVNSSTSTSINSRNKMINNTVNNISDPKSVTSVKESTLMANRAMPGDKLASQSNASQREIVENFSDVSSDENVEFLSVDNARSDPVKAKLIPPVKTVVSKSQTQSAADETRVKKAQRAKSSVLSAGSHGAKQNAPSSSAMLPTRIDHDLQWPTLWKPPPAPPKSSRTLTRVNYIDLEGKLATMVTHDDYQTKSKLFMCNICDLWFDGNKEMKVHWREKHVPKPTVPCKRCPQLFMTERLAQDHEAFAHAMEIRKEKKAEADKHLKAMIAKFWDTQRQRVMLDLKKDRKKLKKSNFVPHGHFLCFECDKYFVTKAMLVIHNRAVHNKSNFICDICGKLYCNKSALKAHQEECGKPKPMLPCKICGKKLSNKTKMAQHLRVVHTNERNYECEVCKKRFNQFYNLRFHIKTQHNGERKYYECPKCKKVFTALNSVRLHDISAHQAIDCMLCDETVIGKAELREHIAAVHRKPKVKKFACGDCPKSYATKATLLTHWKSQHEVKPQEENRAVTKELIFCDVCSKAYLVKASLVRHLAVKHGFVEPRFVGDRNVGRKRGKPGVVTNGKKAKTSEVMSSKTNETSLKEGDCAVINPVDEETTIVRSNTGKANENIAETQGKKKNPLTEMDCEIMSSTKKDTLLKDCQITKPVAQGKSSKAGKAKEKLVETQRKKKLKKQETLLTEVDCEVMKIVGEKPSEEILNANIAESQGEEMAEKNETSLKEVDCEILKPVEEERSEESLNAGTAEENLAESQGEDMAENNEASITDSDCEIIGPVVQETEENLIAGRMGHDLYSNWGDFRPRKTEESLYDESYLKYMALSNKKPMLPCKICGKKLSNTRKMAQHLKVVHTNDRNFECEVCKKRFNQFYNLRFHIKTQHNGERKYYECPKCKKVFTALNSVRLHDISAHQAIDCMLCDETVIGKAELREHIAAVHRKPKVKIFACGDCPKSYATKATLLTHRKSQHEVKPQEENRAKKKELIFCDFCSKAYLVKASLVRHLAVKHGFVEPRFDGDRNVGRKRGKPGVVSNGKKAKTSEVMSSKTNEISLKEGDCVVFNPVDEETTIVSSKGGKAKENIAEMHRKKKTPLTEMDCDVMKIVGEKPSGENLNVEKTKANIAESQGKEMAEKNETSLKEVDCEILKPVGEERSEGSLNMGTTVENLAEPQDSDCEIIEPVVQETEENRNAVRTGHDLYSNWGDCKRAGCCFRPRKTEESLYDESYLKYMAMRNKKPKVPCKICGKKFSTARKTAQRRSECNVCKNCLKKFYNQRFLIKTQHDGEQNFYECVKCKKVFTSLNKFRLHDVSMHQAVGCTLCDETVKDKTELGEHTAFKHHKPPSKVKKFPCGSCKKSFSIETNLLSHWMSQHIDKEPEKDVPATKEPFFCDICNKAYAVKASMLQHLTVEHGFVESYFVDNRSLGTKQGKRGVVSNVEKVTTSVVMSSKTNETSLKEGDCAVIKPVIEVMSSKSKVPLLAVVDSDVTETVGQETTGESLNTEEQGINNLEEQTTLLTELDSEVMKPETSGELLNAGETKDNRGGSKGVRRSVRSRRTVQSLIKESNLEHMVRLINMACKSSK